MTEAEQQELDRLSRSERLTRNKLATMCEAVMVRVIELEGIEAHDSYGAAVATSAAVAKKLRSAVLAATDFTSSSTNHG